MKVFRRLRVNFISNLDLAETSGGWSGINVAIHQQLSEQFDTRFVGPINPGSDYSAKLISKMRRLQGRQGSFHFFSERRLQKIAELVELGVDRTAACDFFHGATPWIRYESPRPYFLYLDTCFSTYMNVYHDRTQFLSADLQRISELEARWLAGAARVFFGTDWALKQAASDYQIPETNLSSVGAGGSMTPPENDGYDGGLNFLFVALDFERKGGRLCVEAFARVHKKFPAARLRIVGQPPPQVILAAPGISYEGLLNKSMPAELRKLESLYATAFALVHPTSSDIQPLIISEAGYFGCPAIAAKSFGIPELIVDDVTGFLIDTPLTAESFAERMIGLAVDSDRYLKMREAVRRHATTNLTWPAVGSRMINEMTAELGLPGSSFSVDSLFTQSALVS
jgi:glycosyltransferase involved in cell wall biosynthesis